MKLLLGINIVSLIFTTGWRANWITKYKIPITIPKTTHQYSVLSYLIYTLILYPFTPYSLPIYTLFCTHLHLILYPFTPYSLSILSYTHNGEAQKWCNQYSLCQLLHYAEEFPKRLIINFNLWKFAWSKLTTFYLHYIHIITFHSYTFRKLGLPVKWNYCLASISFL